MSSKNHPLMTLAMVGSLPFEEIMCQDPGNARAMCKNRSLEKESLGGSPPHSPQPSTCGTTATLPTEKRKASDASIKTYSELKKQKLTKSTASSKANSKVSVKPSAKKVASAQKPTTVQKCASIAKAASPQKAQKVRRERIQVAKEDKHFRCLEKDCVEFFASHKARANHARQKHPNANVLYLNDLHRASNRIMGIPESFHRKTKFDPSALDQEMALLPGGRFLEFDVEWLHDGWKVKRTSVVDPAWANTVEKLRKLKDCPLELSSKFRVKSAEGGWIKAAGNGSDDKPLFCTESSK